MLGEIDKLIVRYGAYIAVLEQGLNQANLKIKQLEAAHAELELVHNELKASVDTFVGEE